MPHNSDNYTIGGMQFVFEGENFGNLVTASITSDITYLDHFSAISGTNVKDRSLVQEVSMTISLTLDEPTEEMVQRFMLADGAGNVLQNLEIKGAAVLHAVSSTGNQFVWNIPSCVIKPDGDFTYSADDWSQFSLTVDVLSAEDGGYGTIVHSGINTTGATAPIQGT